ncbi:MAG TPA: serine/threonine-protein kinase [Ignavibacteriaceae bacterium]|nr:serine/threonine-protein kinase [Ignavibacteriaceae bacterium]
MSLTSTEFSSKFEIIEVIKKDNQTAVYLAYHLELKKEVLLKTLNTEALSDPIVFERFKRESNILSKLEHPNIIKLLDYGSICNTFYICFEYFHGKTLRHYIQNEALAYEDKILIIYQMLNGLMYIHQNDVVHRDIKPENILVNEDLSEVKIVDFGLSFGKNESYATNKSSIVGTPSYMSPEQIRGEKLTSVSDIFSAGVVCYEILTGVNPFLGKDLNETINNLFNFTEIKFDELKNFPLNIQNTLYGMLNKNISNRTQTVQEVLSMLATNVPMKRKVYIFSKSAYNDLFYFVLRNKYKFTLTVFTFVVFGIIYFNSEHNTIEYAPSSIVLPDSMSTITLIKKADTPVEKKEVPVSNKQKTGKLNVSTLSGTEVYIDNRLIGSAPLRDVKLDEGNYKIKLIHPEHSVVNRSIAIRQDEITNFNFEFTDYSGYLNCLIYPWGNIYVDDKFISVSPLQKPIKLPEGNHTVKIVNPQYGQIVKSINIKNKQTEELRINLEKEFQKQTTSK